MAWSYQREESKSFTVIPEGEHRIRIKAAEKTQSKSGKDMLALQFDVSGYNSTLYHYILFLPDRPEITNRQLTQFFDSFKEIPDGDFDTAHWIGKVGACKVKHEEYNGNTSAKVHYFISADKAANLPAWVEPENTSTENGGASTTGENGFMNIPDGIDVPF